MQGGGDSIASEEANVYIAQGFSESRYHGWRRKNFEIWHSKNGKKYITITSMASIRKNFLFNNDPFVGF